MSTARVKLLASASAGVCACLALGGCLARPAPYPYYAAPAGNYAYPYEESPYLFVAPEQGRYEREERQEEEHESPQEEQHESPREERREERKEHDHHG